jgi:hypothetical protein
MTEEQIIERMKEEIAKIFAEYEGWNWEHLNRQIGLATVYKNKYYKLTDQILSLCLNEQGVSDKNGQYQLKLVDKRGSLPYASTGWSQQSSDSSPISNTAYLQAQNDMIRDGFMKVIGTGR